MQLPNGWQEDGTFVGCLAFRHAEYGFLTVDPNARTAAVGLTVPRGRDSIVDSKKYKGRGWLDKLISDAIKAAEKLWAS